MSEVRVSEASAERIDELEPAVESALRAPSRPGRASWACQPPTRRAGGAGAPSTRSGWAARTPRCSSQSATAGSSATRCSRRTRRRRPGTSGRRWWRSRRCRVLPDERGGGVGAALMRAAEEWARERRRRDTRGRAPVHERGRPALLRARGLPAVLSRARSRSPVARGRASCADSGAFGAPADPMLHLRCQRQRTGSEGWASIRWRAAFAPGRRSGCGSRRRRPIRPSGASPSPTARCARRFSATATGSPTRRRSAA